MPNLKVLTQRAMPAINGTRKWILKRKKHSTGLLTCH